MLKLHQKDILDLDIMVSDLSCCMRSTDTSLCIPSSTSTSDLVLAPLKNGALIWMKL